MAFVQSRPRGRQDDRTLNRPASVRPGMTLSRPLPFGPLDRRTTHLCIDMQNLFAEHTPWHTPWMKRVLPAVVEIAERHREQTIFTRFIPARHRDELPGSWRRMRCAAHRTKPTMR